MALLKTDFRDTSKQKMPDNWSRLRRFGGGTWWHSNAFGSLTDFQKTAAKAAFL